MNTEQPAAAHSCIRWAAVFFTKQVLELLSLSHLSDADSKCCSQAFLGEDQSIGLVEYPSGHRQ